MGEIKLRFRLDFGRIEFGTFISMAKLKPSMSMQEIDWEAMRNVLASCLIDDNDEFMEQDEAERIINKLKMSQVMETANEFTRQVRDSAVNPQNAVS